MTAPNYKRPAFDSKTHDKLQKPERRMFGKNRERAKKKLTRGQVIELVYMREKMRCQRCKCRTVRPSKCMWEGDPAMAHVNEMKPRSLGGDPLALENLELICQGCHMPNGRHAPTVERMKRLQRSAK